jgi:hypothetical protein
MAQQTDHIGDTNKMVTAVQWLIEKQLDAGYGLPKEWREQAKAMEKHQIMSAYDLGNQNQYNKICISNYVNIDEEQYYNETYNK